MVRERAILIGVNINNQENFNESMEELKGLASACDIEVVGCVEQNLKVYNKAYCIGTGKVKEVVEELGKCNASTVIFDNELSPSQLRNLEKALNCRILDRTYLILEIFKSRAKTREAKLQVEVACLKYLLPRLVGSNEELGRQGGGAGLRNKGAGETKLELDRRKIEEKLAFLNKELDGLQNERTTQRSKRNKVGLKNVALVGYTNAGKSTLMNAFVEDSNKGLDKKVFEKDMLFATLETSVRNITLKDKNEILLSDTVGFVSKLPHDLVKAFRSTLMEVKHADLLLHVIDVSNENYKEHIRVTNETLEQIGADNIPTIYVFNKADLNEMTIPRIEEDSIYLSARNRVGIIELSNLISEQLFSDYIESSFLIPYDKGNIVSYLNEHARVKTIEYDSEGTLLTVDCKERDYNKLSQYLVSNSNIINVI